MYREFLPGIQLKPYIDRYWVNQGFVYGQQQLIIPADGCVDIIFATGEAASARSMKDYHPYIVGTMDTYSEEIFSNQVEMLGIRFNPVGITAFVRTQVHELTNSKIDLLDVESLFGQDFYLPLQEQGTLIQKLEYINCYLISKLPHLYTVEERILQAVKYISESNGQMSVNDIIKDVCLSPRQFERLFKSSVGISAKKYSRIVRLKYTQKYIEAYPHASVFSVAVDCGYYDHSHLIRDFNVLAGRPHIRQE
jgi:AraC-like DNA-binding protein